MNKRYLQTIHQIICTGHWITDQVSQVLKPFEITEPQYNVLRVLQAAEGRPLTVQEILEQMVQRSSNITRIVDKLIDKGLADRKECPSNRRKMDITITAAGKRLLKKLDKEVYKFHEPYSNNLTIKELNTLSKLIQKLRS